MHVILQNQDRENMSKDMDFCHSREIYLRNMEKKLLNTAIKTGLDTLKTVSKKAVYKAAEARLNL